MSHAESDREGLSPPPPNILNLFDEDDDESDDVFQPATDESGMSELASTVDEEDEEDGSYADAHENLGGIEIVFEGDDDEDEEDGDEGDDTERENENENEESQTSPAPPTDQGTRITIQDLNNVLGAQGTLRRLLMQRYRLLQPGTRRVILDSVDDDDDDDEDNYGIFRRRHRRRPKPTGDRFPKIPSDAGRALMDSGTYGQRDDFTSTRHKRRMTFSEKLMWRRMGLDPRPHARKANRLIAQDLVPTSTLADRIIHYDSRAYSGQFSDDGNFFFSCTQNFKVRMYDTSNPYQWRYYKNVDYPFGQWTITDATLSPDNRYLAYSSIRHMVCLAPTDPSDTSDPTLLDFTDFATDAQGNVRSHGGYGYMGRNGFGIWSLRFSGDGREIVAGTSDHSVVVYDLERRCSTVRLSNHGDDVNAVCFGDKSSPHILYSGSDDQTLRVWDRRSMADGREAGVFVGHTEGLTYVDSKGDGRYVLSNGKDQMMKLWDLRKMVSPGDFSKMNLNEYTSNFDYRFSPYDEDDYVPNPNDCSVVTFRGHSVLKTLIRCHFSPPNSSNSRYVYSGSEDGKVWIYNIDGTVKGTVDVGKATRNSRPRGGGGEGMYGYDAGGRENGTWKTCVRDASWSPSAPVMAATSWNGWGMSTGTVTVHSWNDGAEDDEGEPAMGANYNARLDMREDFNRMKRDERSRDSGRLRSNPVRRRMFGVGGTGGGAGGGGAGGEGRVDGDGDEDW